MPDLIQQQFLKALAQGDVDRIREFIAAGADVNRPIGNPGGETPLIRAITAEQLNLVDLLIENGADVNLRWAGPTFWTPLMFAHNNPAILARLLAAGADVNARAAVQYIDTSSPGRRSGGETTLHLAAAANNSEAVNVLVHAGAEVEAKAEDDCAPLDYAIRMGSATAAAVALAEAGAELTPERLARMHSAAHNPESDFVSASPERFAQAPNQQTIPPEVQGDAALQAESDRIPRCPSCHALLYSRIPKLCGNCGKLLPAELLVSEQKTQTLQDERKWTRELASKFDYQSSLETHGQQRPLRAPKDLLRKISCADEFKDRKRPSFPLYILGYYCVFLLPAFVIIRLGVAPSSTVLGVTVALIAFFCYRAWQRASPICPNCKQNIRFCPAAYCHVCGERLRHNRCLSCDVDHSWTSFLVPGRSGNFQNIAFCPGCGVFLDSHVPRWRPSLRKGDY